MNTLEHRMLAPSPPEEIGVLPGDEVFAPDPDHSLGDDEFSVAFEPPHLDQGSLGSCTAHDAVQMLFSKQSQMLGKPAPLMSPEALYYETLKMAGREGQDTGATMREILQALRDPGAIPYDVHPTDGYRLRKPPEFAVRTQTKGFWTLWPGFDHTPFYAAKAMRDEGMTLSIHARIPKSDMLSTHIMRTGIFSTVTADEPYEAYGHAMCLSRRRIIGGEAYWGTPGSWGKKWWYIPEKNLQNRHYCVALFCLKKEWF